MNRQTCTMSVFGILLAAVPFAAVSAAPAITWQESTHMPEPRDGYAAGVIDGRLIIIGGGYWEGTKDNWHRKVFSATTHAFDPRTHVWEKLPDVPVSLGYPASAQVSGKIFIIGGNQNGEPSRDVHVFQRVGGKFRCDPHSRLPQPRLFASAVAVGSKIYVIGGTHQYEPFDEKGHCCTSHTATNTGWVLDTNDASRTWKPLPEYPGEPRWLQSAAAVGSDIYVFGGIVLTAQNVPPKKFNNVLRYGTVTGEWTQVGEMPESLQSAAAVSVAGRIILVGTKHCVMSYDPRTAVFSPLDSLPRDAMVTRFVWIDPLLVGAGGENTLDGPRRRSEWTFIGRPSATLLGGSHK